MDFEKLFHFTLLFSLVTGQDIAVCKQPRIGFPCKLTCSTNTRVETVQFYRNETQIKACSVHVNINDCSFKMQKTFEVIFTLNSVTKFDEGHWSCSDGESKGSSKKLQPYSFEEGKLETPEENPDTKVEKISVTAHCVYPKPEIVIRFCSKVMCKGEGEIYFNGECGDDHVQNYRYECTIDFDDWSTDCESTNPAPVQASIYANDHLVYFEFTKDTYYGKGTTDDICINRTAFIILAVLLGLIFLLLTCLICRKDISFRGCLRKLGIHRGGINHGQSFNDINDSS